MPDYKKNLFNSLTDILNIIVKAQEEAEEDVIADRQQLLKILETKLGESDSNEN